MNKNTTELLTLNPAERTLARGGGGERRTLVIKSPVKLKHATRQQGQGPRGLLSPPEYSARSPSLGK
jgi:hypothetical protein